jgi:hypothetical protein
MAGLDTMVFYRVDRDDQAIADMRDVAVAFWRDHVLAKRAAGADHDGRRDHALQAHRGRPVDLDEEHAEALANLRAVRSSIDALKGDQAELELKVAKYVCAAWSVPLELRPTAPSCRQREPQGQRRADPRRQVGTCRRKARTWISSASADDHPEIKRELHGLAPLPHLPFPEVLIPRGEPAHERCPPRAGQPFRLVQRSPKREADAMVAVEQSRAIAETQAAMVIAKKFPRDPIAAMDRILNACTRPTLAEAGALHVQPRRHRDHRPEHPRCRALAQKWGNMQFGIRELEQRAGESTVEAFAWDIETNTRQVKVFQVKHVRDTKKGSYALTDSATSTSSPPTRARAGCAPASSA